MGTSASDGQDTMRIAMSGRPPRAHDVATAIERAVAQLGQRPAITGQVLDRPVGSGRGAPAAGRRREQGYASLAGWVAKGANLLQSELGLGVGDRLALAGPPGWPLAAVTLSAWWLGVTITPIGSAGTPSGPGPDVVVTHVGAAPGADTPWSGDAGRTVPWFSIGDALDGTSVMEGAVGPDRTVEQWTDAVTPHGDRPPGAVRDGDLVALRGADGTEYTQRMLLASADADGGVGTEDDGVLGLLRDGDEDILARPDGARRLAALALRPLVTGAATVIIDVDDPDRAAIARSERVTRWLD